MTFKNKHIVVTGAAGGIGRGIAFELAAQGARLSLLDNNAERLSQTLALLTDHGDRVSTHCLDIGQTEALCDWLAARDAIDGLVHCAAKLNGGSLLTASVDSFQKMLQINVQSSYVLLQKMANRMIEQGTGAIVVVGSNAATTPRQNIGGYGATKAALHMLTKNFALELGQFGIRCNTVSPGSTRTEMLEQTWNAKYGETETIAGSLEQFRLGIPLQKIAEPQDIAQAVAFLLSDAAGHITMHDLRVDGGATLNQM